MTVKHKFDAEKTIEVILYIAKRCPDMYTALKILYFADKEHLTKYGRLISGDIYVAMNHGPVPSGAYDLVKYARENSVPWKNISLDKAFTVQGNNIIPLREANTDYLSESDMERLNQAIEEYGHLSFSQLRQLSHDDAYKAADRNDFIPLDAIARTLPDGDLLTDYLHNG